jgi:ubiquitin C-terminal hydrolase
VQHDNSLPKHTTYDLVAVINHRGGLGGGHYVAYAKNSLTSKWYEFDDRTVSEVDEDYVQNVEAYSSNYIGSLVYSDMFSSTRNKCL